MTREFRTGTFPALDDESPAKDCETLRPSSGEINIEIKRCVEASQHGRHRRYRARNQTQAQRIPSRVV